MTTQSEKQRNQVKSRFYYLFWGIATVSVVAGQLYVVEYNELDDLLDIPYGKFILNK